MTTSRTIAALARGVPPATREQLAELRRRLDAVPTWTTSVQGLAGRHRPKPPISGLRTPYPGVPYPEPGDPNQRAHWRWSLMMLTLMNRTDLSLTTLAKRAGCARYTPRDLLNGQSWGLPETRVKLTWEVWRRVILDQRSVEVALILIAQDGAWLPPGATRVSWRLVSGRATWRLHD